MKFTINKFAVSALMLSAMGAVQAAEITGAGATFPYPIYAKWADVYNKETGTKLNYQSIGSGGGIKQIKAKTVDFGASDKPLKPEELEEAGLMQFPAIMGGVVPVINLKGLKSGEIKLTGQALADIYLGKIKKWNDPALVVINKGVNLPDTDIAVVHRSDGSGTTFLFVNYLSQVAEDWKNGPGVDSSVKWPVGVGGKGNEGVASYVQKIEGAIGYVEYAYAKQNNLPIAALGNADGKFVMPNDDSFRAAASNADWAKAPGMYLVLTNQAGAKSWPITGASFILMHKIQDKPEMGKEVLKFYEWSFKHGQKLADELDYVSMPDSVVKLIQAEWKKLLKDPAGKPIY
ncbi:MAG: phosphate ABC transporter substrate-binding protein PstS [Burkholderiaceae bacterium]|nr:MAG: phosphate ABC transporter substrate-binding protein PstS [Burkholderiaceae bacterium]